MTKEFKYIEDKDQYLDFLVGFQDISTNQILADESIIKLYRGQVKEDGTPNAKERLLKMAESFLFLHQDREDYELCQLIIDNYPELRSEDC
jgi:hemerythrin